MSHHLITSTTIRTHGEPILFRRATDDEGRTIPALVDRDGDAWTALTTTAHIDPADLSSDRLAGCTVEVAAAPGAPRLRRRIVEAHIHPDRTAELLLAE